MPTRISVSRICKIRKICLRNTCLLMSNCLPTVLAWQQTKIFSYFSFLSPVCNQNTRGNSEVNICSRKNYQLIANHLHYLIIIYSFYCLIFNPSESGCCVFVTLDLNTLFALTSSRPVLWNRKKIKIPLP